MKTFKASQLSSNPAKVFAEARKNGAIIQQCRTNGEIIEEFLIISNNPLVRSGHSIQMVKDMAEA